MIPRKGKTQSWDEKILSFALAQNPEPDAKIARPRTSTSARPQRLHKRPKPCCKPEPTLAPFAFPFVIPRLSVRLLVPGTGTWTTELLGLAAAVVGNEECAVVCNQCLLQLVLAVLVDVLLVVGDLDRVISILRISVACCCHA